MTSLPRPGRKRGQASVIPEKEQKSRCVAACFDGFHEAEGSLSKTTARQRVPAELGGRLLSIGSSFTLHRATTLLPLNMLHEV